MDAAPTPLSPAPTPASVAAPTLPPRIHRRSAFVAAALGWTLPGLGQVYVGRPLKGLLMLVAIGGLFALGLFLTGFTCVDPYSYGLEFVAHMWIGGPTAAAYWLSRDIVLVDPLPYFEVGRLYASVAGLLNAVAICDALGSVLERNEAAGARDMARQTLVLEHAAALALAAVRRESEAPEGQAGLTTDEAPPADGGGGERSGAQA